MRPEVQSKRILGITRSKAKMYEYAIPEQYHIDIPHDPAELFTLTIGLLGDYSAKVNQSGNEDVTLNELRKNLLFSAHFFDSYIETKLNEKLDPYLLLMGSAAYYLCDLPGSSSVLASRIGEDCPDLGAKRLEELLLWVLQADWGTCYEGMDGIYGKCIDLISESMSNHFSSGNSFRMTDKISEQLRTLAYSNGSPREVLFSDVICAIIKKRFANSTWNCLPKYSDLTVEQWIPALKKESFIKELWPAQHLLGERGIFNGNSAVIQMPTSAGKTKAIEIVLRSAFISGRASLAVIVAPFRALCHEIKNSLYESFKGDDVIVDEVSDIPQKDFTSEGFISLIFDEAQSGTSDSQKHVLVVTPEKLIYMLRQVPELADSIGLVIYDEGHQFDSGRRGITYELLLTSLKSMIPNEAQTILISAVISNANDIGEWLNGDQCQIVSGTNLIPTYRTVGFASWLDQRGRLEFINQDNPDMSDFFVPRLIEQQQLQRRPRERKERIFPEKDDGKMIALYLGLKLVNNGSVAIFCGTKPAASKLCKEVLDKYSRGLELPLPAIHSNRDEIKRLYFLHLCHLGEDAIATKNAMKGIFAHHGNTSAGLRLSIEYALQKELIFFVVCTSTLAQGVNLPIRYLIVTGTRQGKDQIKVRDFHNLIGRAGRSGMHTEGSILFSDTSIFDKKNMPNYKDRNRWTKIKEMLIPENSEPCASTLLTIFDPLVSDNKKYYLVVGPLELVKLYIQTPDKLDSFITTNALQHSESDFSEGGLRSQIQWKLSIISSIESYLLAHWDDSQSGFEEKDVEELATSTLAYYLADEKQKISIIDFFKLLARNIEQKVPEAPKRKALGRTLYGVRDAAEIETWISQNLNDILLCENSSDLLTVLWPIVAMKISNKSFTKCDKPEALIDIAKGWITGEPFYKLLQIFNNAEARIIWGEKRRNYNVEHLVDICENGFSYDGTLALGAVTEILRLIQPDTIEAIATHIELLQKQLKYGLWDSKAIALYEIGLSDRIIAMDVCSVLNKNTKPYRSTITSELRKQEVGVREILNKYPKYFSERFDALL